MPPRGNMNTHSLRFNQQNVLHRLAFSIFLRDIYSSAISSISKFSIRNSKIFPSQHLKTKL